MKSLVVETVDPHTRKRSRVLLSEACPNLVELARSVLSCPNSNAEEERKFSSGKRISVSSGCPSTIPRFSQRVILDAAGKSATDTDPMSYLDHESSDESESDHDD